MIPTRRRLLLLAPTLIPGILIPGAARGQNTAPPAVVPPPPSTITPPAPTLPSVPAPDPVPVASPAQTGPARPPAPAAIDRTKQYFVFFEQTIDANSMKALRRQFAALVEAGVRHVTLVVHSPGGGIDPMLGTYSFLRALPIRLDTHAIGFVASAATVLFLAGERRTADRAARFLYHPSSAPFTGTMNGPQMQDRLNQFAAVNQVEEDIFRDRTTLSPGELRRFTREEVIYTPDEALQGGIIQAIGDLHLPGPDTARMLFLD